MRHYAKGAIRKKTLMEKPPGIGEFLVARGGPFYELQRRLGLLREEAFHAGSRAVLFVFLAWGVPLLLSLIEGHALGSFADRPYLLALGPWSRYFIAVGLFVLMERQIEDRLRLFLRQFLSAPLLAPGSFEPAARAVNRALRRRDSPLAEAVCLLLAILGTLFTFFNMADTEVSTWALRVAGDERSLTLAGWWAVLVSNLVFGFLLLRWLWRHAVWAVLLRDIAALDLRLVASHPDGHGGLAFVGQYPNAYVTYVLAVSFVVGAAVAKQMLEAGLDTATYSYIMTGWLIIVLALFAVPLMAFVKPLKTLKEKTILASSAQATRHFRASERGVLGRNISAAEDAEAEAGKEAPDPTKVFAAAQKLKTLPFSRTALLPISAAALLPLVGAGATQLPFKEILAVFKRLLLL